MVERNNDNFLYKLTFEMKKDIFRFWLFYKSNLANSLSLF